MQMSQWLQTGWSTHKGRRDVNEDAVHVEGSLLAVADGVGGAPRGDLASFEAIETLRDVIDEPTTSPETPVVASELTAALLLVDEAVTALASRWSELRGTATTMCAAYIFVEPGRGPRAVVANIGDSRCYHIRGGSAQQITTDQTLAVQLRQQGQTNIFSKAERIVTSILGGPPNSDTTIHVYRVDLDPNDILLLCTDGISDHLTATQLAQICSRTADPNLAAAELVRAAWDNDSHDNLTAAVAYITETAQHRTTPLTHKNPQSPARFRRR